MDAGGCGGHAFALGSTGEIAVGEFRSCRAIVFLRPLFSLADARVPFVSRRCCEGARTRLRCSGLCARVVMGRLIRSGWPSS